MSQDGERLAILETRMNNLEDSHKEVKEEVKSINKTIWLAMGGLTAVSFLIQVLLKH